MAMHAATIRKLGITLLGVCAPIIGLAQSPARRDLTQTSLEDLMNVEVTSVSRKEQKLSKAGAAVFVLNQEDIRRSGATNIPDLLRIVPGVDVARINANAWAISIRGFNGRYANKVLVLIDGRSVYTPTFSGVDWDQQDVPLEDIERIEVIRGPGGTVWGANAVNGVINIITKSARATKGGLLSAGAGSSETAQGLLQYGGSIGQNGAYRVFGKSFNIGGADMPGGIPARDGWHSSHGGFRSDWDLSTRDTLTVQGDLLRTGEGQTITTVFANALPLQRTFNERFEGGEGNILGRWNRTLHDGSDMSLQIYYDRYNRVEQGGGETLNTLDLDFQHHFKIGSRHDIVWGAGYRDVRDTFTAGYATTFDPPQRATSLFSTFVQDEIRVTNSLWLTLGSKFEHNAYTGFENEPSARLVWTPNDRHAIWLAASRAIRQPDRAESAVQVDAAIVPLAGGGFGVVKLSGNPGQRAEQLRDYEAGYRAQLNKAVSVDIAAFASFYRRLSTNEPGSPFFTMDPAPAHLVLPLTLDNTGRARTHGVEIFANWNVIRRWRISPGYTALHVSVARDPPSQASPVTSGDSPEHQFQVRSFLNLTRRLDWDTTLGYIGRLGDGPVPGYARLDTRLGWRVGESVEISLTGQNLLTPRHAEFHDANGTLHSLVERGIFGKITWRF